MKILVIMPFGTDAYNPSVIDVLDKVRREDTSIVVENLSRGPAFIRYAYFQSLIVPDIVDRIIRAEKQGFDGVFVSCCFEPGVKEAREVVDIPVVGGSMPAVFIARQLGQRFGFVTDTERANVITYDLFKQHKLDVECVGIRSIEMKVEQIRIDPETNQRRVIDLAEDLVSAGADVIINGCTIVAASFKKDHIPETLLGIPFLDANVTALKTVEMFTDLHCKYGLTVSRKNCYANPRETEPNTFSKVRSQYGYSSDAP